MSTYSIGILIFTICAAVNVVASLLTLYLIYKLKKYNGYMLMIFSMTMAQLSYDASLFMFNIKTDLSYYIQSFLGIFCGTASAIWSLVISLVLTYIVVTRKYIDIGFNFPTYFIIVTLLSLFIAISNVWTIINGDKELFAIFFNIFNYTRILIIVINILTILYTSYLLFKTKHSSYNRHNRSPLFILVTRLCLYPLVQFISRAPITIYQLSYKYPLFQYAYQTNPTNIESFFFIFSVITCPSAGLGNFIAFLMGIFPCYVIQIYILLVLLILFFDAFFLLFYF